MKLVALTSAAFLAASSAFAGSYNTEVVTPDPVDPVAPPAENVEPAPTGSLGAAGGWLVPIFAMALIGIAVSASSEDNKSDD